MKSALLLSGGQDSTALAYLIKPAVAITVDYGQRPASAELRASEQICQAIGIEHIVVRADCSQLGSGDLTEKPAIEAAPSSEWWPYRNQLIITLASAAALSSNCDELLIGAVANDAGHVDGRAEFFDAMNAVTQMQEGHLRIKAPALSMTSTQLIQKSNIPLDILCWSHSCHRSNLACGQCRGCLKHKNVMYELGVTPF